MYNSREGRVGGWVGEGGSESVRNAWWHTEPAATAAYKWRYYITLARSMAAARLRPAKANHQHSGKQPAHTPTIHPCQEQPHKPTTGTLGTSCQCDWTGEIFFFSYSMWIVDLRWDTCSSFPVLLVSWVKCDQNKKRGNSRKPSRASNITQWRLISGHCIITLHLFFLRQKLFNINEMLVKVIQMWVQIHSYFWKINQIMLNARQIWVNVRKMLVNISKM